MSRDNRPTVVVLHNQVGDESAQDELDVITQVNVVSEALAVLDYDPVSVPLALDLQSAVDRIHSLKPAFVFNLVESIAGTGRLIYFAPALLDNSGHAYTGSGTDAMYLTTNKPLSKTVMNTHHIATPAWTSFNGSIAEPGFDPPYILKPAWEDASVGLNTCSVFHKKTDLLVHIKNQQPIPGDWFAEAYIPGREFNISILATAGEPQVLPAAEIDFIDFPADKPKIVDYKAKWETDSFEYQHTVRRFDFPSTDNTLIAELNEITRRCWKAFNLNGYARVDFRIDTDGKPWVLEINANPCISPDSGFVAAAERAGIDFNTVVRRIIDDIPQYRWLREK